MRPLPPTNNRLALYFLGQCFGFTEPAGQFRSINSVVAATETNYCASSSSIGSPIQWRNYFVFILSWPSRGFGNDRQPFRLVLQSGTLHHCLIHPSLARQPTHHRLTRPTLVSVRGFIYFDWSCLAIYHCPWRIQRNARKRLTLLLEYDEIIIINCVRLTFAHPRQKL